MTANVQPGGFLDRIVKVIDTDREAREPTLEELREGRSIPGSEELLALVTEFYSRSPSRSRDHLRVVGRPGIVREAAENGITRRRGEKPATVETG